MENFRRELVRKGDFLIVSGERHQAISFLIKGVARGYLIDADGREITDCFAFHTGDVLMGCSQLDEVSQINIEAVTECEVYQIPVAVVKGLIQKYPELLLTYNQFLLRGISRHWEIKMSLCRYRAAERYQWFLDAYPGLIDIVSNKDVASFLGITPVTLSRLRRRLREDGRPALERADP